MTYMTRGGFLIVRERNRCFQCLSRVPLRLEESRNLFIHLIFRDVVADGISNCARVAQSASKWVRLQRSVVVGSMTCRLLHCGGLKESSGELEAKATRKTGVKI